MKRAAAQLCMRDPEVAKELLNIVAHAASRVPFGSSVDAEDHPERERELPASV